MLVCYVIIILCVNITALASYNNIILLIYSRYFTTRKMQVSRIGTIYWSGPFFFFIFTTSRVKAIWAGANYSRLEVYDCVTNARLISHHFRTNTQTHTHTHTTNKPIDRVTARIVAVYFIEKLYYERTWHCKSYLENKQIEIHLISLPLTHPVTTTAVP